MVVLVLHCVCANDDDDDDDEIKRPFLSVVFDISAAAAAAHAHNASLRHIISHLYITTK